MRPNPWWLYLAITGWCVIWTACFLWFFKADLIAFYVSWLHYRYPLIFW